MQFILHFQYLFCTYCVFYFNHILYSLILWQFLFYIYFALISHSLVIGN
nr:MAG TPA: hypothetical protein [Caudoviricetes sp.]